MAINRSFDAMMVQTCLQITTEKVQKAQNPCFATTTSDNRPEPSVKTDEYPNVEEFNVLCMEALSLYESSEAHQAFQDESRCSYSHYTILTVRGANHLETLRGGENSSSFRHCIAS